MGKSIRVAKGKEVFEIDAQDLPFAAKDGFLPTERIIVANSKTKESFEIDPADYLNAVNDGFEFADLAKKKEPIPSNLPPSPAPSPSPSDANIEQPVTIQQIRQLESIPQQGTLNVSGTGLGTQYEVATTESPELKAAKKRYAEQLGVDYGDLQEMLQDFPNADENFIATAKKYKEQSPELYRRYLDASYALRALPKEQQADFNEWQSYQSLPQLESNMAKAMDALSSNKEAQRRLYRTNAPFINPSNDDVFLGTQQFNKDYSAKLQSPISEFEYSGLKTLEIFNPDIAKQYKDILLNHSDVREGQLAYERVSKELESIGRENLIRAAKETNDIVRYYENAIKQAETPEKAQAIAAEAQKDTRVKNAAKVSGAVEQMMLRQQYDSLRYTQLGMLQAEKVYNDIARSNMTTLDALAAMPKEFLVGGGRIVNNALQTLGDLVVGNTWVMPDAETKSMISAFSQATAQQESDPRYLQKSLYNLTPDLQAQVDDILKSDADSETKRSQVIQLVLGNPDKVIPNPKADETDVKSQDILLGGAKLFGEVFALSLLARGTGAGAASTRMQQAATTFGSTALGFYNDMYNSAVSSGSKNPRLDAALDTAIAALSELISPDYQVVRRFLGKSSSPILLGLTEETWNAVMRRLPNLPTAALRGGIAAAKNLGGEVIEEVAGAAGQQVKDRVIMGRETAREDASFGEKMAFGQGIQKFSDAVTDAALQTAVLMAVPSTVTMMTNARGISADAKTKLYALGVRGEAGLPTDMPEKIRKVVAEMQAIVANIKDNYPELNEKQRTEMAFNMYRKKAIQADKATMTEKQKEQADKAIAEADDAIEATVAGEKAVVEQIDGDAKVETDAIDKKIESLNPESEGYKEKKAELKEEKATIKQTAEERKAALREAVRAAFPQTPTNEPTTTEANQPTEAIEGATNPQQIEAGTPTGVQPSIGGMGQGRPAGNVAVEQPIPQQGDTVTVISKTDGKPINYFYNGNSWVFTDSRGKEQKVTQKEAEAVTQEWETAQGFARPTEAQQVQQQPEVGQPIPQADTESQIRNFIQQSIAQFPDATSEEIMAAISEDAPQLVATEEQQQAVADLINQTIAENAVQEQSAAGVDVRQQAEDGEGMGEGNAEIPPTPPTGEQIGGDEEGPKLRDKGILNRLYNAERIPQQAREAFKDNLKYEPKSQVEAKKIAQGIIAEFGIDEAVLRAEAGTFHGDVNSMIFATALNQLYEQESKAQGDEKVAIAKKFADISMRYDEAARSGGRFISAIGYFYKKSPLGMRMLEEANRNEQFKEWIKSKENDYRAFFEELMKEPEVQEMVEKEVRERLKKERAQKRTERKKKVNDAIDKWINDLGKQTYSSVVPPTVLIPVLKAAKGLYNAGESVLEIVEKAVDSIDEKMNGTDWDRDAFRTKLTGMLDEAESADELKRQRAIEKFRNKLKGLSEEQKDKLIRKSLRKLVADGALEFDDFKKMLADIIGMGEMSPEEIAAFEQTVKDMNAAADVADEIANTETLTPEMMQRYNEARVKAEKAAIAYGDLVYNKPDITKRLLSYLQLAPLGIKALVTNPFYNVWQHVAVRIPTAVVGNVVDTILYRASQVGNSIWGTDVLYPKNDPRNIAEVQKQFFKGGFLGTKKAMSQVVTGLTDKDYIQKDMYNSRNKPLVAIRDIFNQLTKKKLMTNKQIFDKMLQGTLGITMEGVARLLNVGDKPMRYAAERAEAARFARELGLKDLELDFFMELPREIAFREYKKRGMTDEAAGEKADEIVNGIIKSGEKSVFQGDNILATAIDSFFEKFGLTGRLFRVLNLPYVKTPLNSLWSLYNLVNPYVALAQVTFYGGRAVANKSRKDYEESKYWLGHAVSGFALHALMGALVQYGIFSPPDEDDESKREREGRKTYNPNGKVNITKLMAFLDGSDPNAVKNGIIVDIQYFGVMGVLGAMITKKNQEMTEEQRKNGMTFIENQLMNLDITTKHFIDQGIFGQTSLAIEAFQKRGAALDQWLLGMINMGTNVVQPAMYAQISRAQLPYYSRQKADDFKGQVKNSMLSRSSVLRDLTGEMPPSKIGVWGDTMSKGGSEFWDVMGRLFGVTRENDDNFAQPIYEDYMKYNDPLFFPPALKPELDGKKLTAQQYDDLQIFVGQQRKELAKPYVNDGATIPFINKKYSELSKEQKLKALEYIYEVGKENGIVLFTQKYKEFQKPFEAPTYESIMEKINNKYMQSFKQMLPKIRN